MDEEKNGIIKKQTVNYCVFIPLYYLCDNRK